MTYQDLGRDLPKKMRENAETIEQSSKVVEAGLETLKEQAKATGSEKLIAQVAKLEEIWESGLKVSHKETAELYETFANEQDKLFATIG